MPFDTKDPKEQSLRIDELSILFTRNIFTVIYILISTWTLVIVSNDGAWNKVY